MRFSAGAHRRADRCPQLRYRHQDHARLERARGLSRATPPAPCLPWAPSVSKRSASSFEPAASQAGLAYGLTGLMRALPVHAASGRVYLPADALLSHGTSPEAVLAGRTEPGLLALLAELRDRARDALGESAAMRSPGSTGPRRRPSCRSVWSSPISPRWREADAIPCTTSPASIRFTAYGAWRGWRGVTERLLRRHRTGLDQPAVEIGERARGHRPLPLEAPCCCAGLCRAARMARDRRKQPEIDVHRLEASARRLRPRR